MREYTVEATAADTDRNNTADVVFDNAERRARHVAVRRRVEGEWRDVTSVQLAEEVLGVARGLYAAGVGAGDRVALMSKTRYEWTVVDLAVLSVGAVLVPIYETSSAEQVQWILADSGARFAVVETDHHQKLVDEVRGECPDLGEVWRIEDGALETLRDRGADVADANVHARRDAVAADDVASIIYTSGTTGRPKGCQLLHRNFVMEMAELDEGLQELMSTDSSTLLFLPLAHVLGRVIQFGSLHSGCTLGHTPDVKNLLDDLGAFRPTFVLSVPRVFEKVYNTAKQRAHSESPVKGRIFDQAEAVAIAYSEGLEKGSVALPVKLAHGVFDRLVYSKLRAALGGRCIAAVSGGAPLGERLGHFYRGVGVTIYEGYGLTETTAGICVNRPGAIRVGTVGRPAGGMSARVADDGELLFRGPMVFGGYWHNEDATRETIDTEGWFHSGDIGEIDDDGFVRITGRKKELIVTAGGKNVAPAVLEDRIRAHWLVGQCLVVGDQKPFIAALITLDPEAVPQWLEKAGRPADTPLEDIVDDADLRAEIQTAVDDANRAVSKAESIRKFTVLAGDWTEEGGQVTPSLKLKRAVVTKEHAADIDALYTR